MKYLLDVSVLVAWGWSDHVAHHRTAWWIASLISADRHRLLTSPISQLGFVRVSVQRTAGKVSVVEATETLTGMLATLGRRHTFLPDDCPAAKWPDWCTTAAKTTDAHLLVLAQAHGARLATLDTGIPGAFLIPEAVGKQA